MADPFQPIGRRHRRIGGAQEGTRANPSRGGAKSDHSSAGSCFMGSSKYQTASPLASVNLIRTQEKR
jgi:hypothetical protein